MAAGRHPVHRHPAWFGVVMGTGALSLVAISQADAWNAPWLEIVAVAGTVVAAVTAIVWVVVVVRTVRILLDKPAPATP